MSTSETIQKSGGLTGVMKNSFKTGLNAAESMHQFAVELPLNMLAGVGVPEDKTTALKDKHRNLLRGVYGAVDSIASRAMDLGSEQAELLTTEIRKRAESGGEVVANVATDVVAEVKKTGKETKKTVKKVEAAASGQS